MKSDNGRNLERDLRLLIEYSPFAFCVGFRSEKGMENRKEMFGSIGNNGGHYAYLNRLGFNNYYAFDCSANNHIVTMSAKYAFKRIFGKQQASNLRSVACALPR